MPFRMIRGAILAWGKFSQIDILLFLLLESHNQNCCRDGGWIFNFIMSWLTPRVFLHPMRIK
jgi:hypothetical protein